MAVDKNAIYNELMAKAEEMCMSEHTCGTCSYDKCLIGYAKMYINECREQQVRAIEGSLDHIPTEDLKGGYDMDAALEYIAELLTMCHSCAENHVDDCVINVVRNCFEVISYGETYDYPGNALTYIMQLQSEQPEKAMQIMALYKEAKAKREA